MDADSNYGYRDETAGERVNPLKTYFVIMLWSCMQNTLFRYSPKPFYFIRRWILRLFGAELASKVYIYPSVRIEYPWNLVMEDYTSIGRDVWVYNLDKVIIKKFATLSQRTHLCCGSHDYTLKNFPLVTKPIVLEEGAWLAAEVFVCPGVTIGKNAVVGARSVVTRNVPDAMVCAGNPCVPIKKRLANEISN